MTGSFTNKFVLHIKQHNNEADHKLDDTPPAVGIRN